jgi:hypothetical protein
LVKIWGRYWAKGNLKFWISGPELVVMDEFVRAIPRAWLKLVVKVCCLAIL